MICLAIVIMTLIGNLQRIVTDACCKSNILQKAKSIHATYIMELITQYGARKFI